MHRSVFSLGLFPLLFFSYLACGQGLRNADEFDIRVVAGGLSDPWGNPSGISYWGSIIELKYKPKERQDAAGAYARSPRRE